MSDAAIIGFLAGMAFRHAELSREALEAWVAAPSGSGGLSRHVAYTTHYRIAKDARENLRAMLSIG